MVVHLWNCEATWRRKSVGLLGSGLFLCALFFEFEERQKETKAMNMAWSYLENSFAQERKKFFRRLRRTRKGGNGV